MPRRTRHNFSLAGGNPLLVKIVSVSLHTPVPSARFFLLDNDGIHDPDYRRD
ncbi:MAG: hypothetical protein IH840_06210 [Candidatus Heimdallarchaeota archaeon]|nr:hypothetical protein [Candidatus Heimdallarchaeota archaeon]